MKNPLRTILAITMVTILIGTFITAKSSTAGEKARDGRFIAYDNGTVLDTKTKLMWAAKDNGSNINWSDAKSYCRNYRGGGYADWRMPTQDELAGLYDESKSRPAVCYGSDSIHLATELIDITCFFPWALEETSNSIAAAFFFNRGLQGYGPKDGNYYFRALPVRSGSHSQDKDTEKYSKMLVSIGTGIDLIMKAQNASLLAIGFNEDNNRKAIESLELALKVGSKIETILFDELYPNKDRLPQKGKEIIDMAVRSFGYRYCIIYSDIGYAYNHIGNNNKAIEYYNISIKLDPKNYNSYFLRGVAHNDKKEYDRAIEDFKRAISLFDMNYDKVTEDLKKPKGTNSLYMYYSYLGMDYDMIGQTEHAINAFTFIIDANQKDKFHSQALRSRAKIYERLKQYDKATEDLKKLNDLPQ